ncbi:hypothetical protein CsSME_00034474 [Camellia sinensis var. sinensis]
MEYTQEVGPKLKARVKDQKLVQLKLQVKENDRNLHKVKDNQILKDNEALTNDPKAPQEDLVITRVQSEELDAMEAVGIEELKQPIASAEQNMPLKHMLELEEDCKID